MVKYGQSDPNPEPSDPYAFGPPGSGSGSSKKNLIPIVLWLLFDFLSLKNYVNVPSKSNKQKNLFKKNVLLLASWRSMTKIAGSGSITVVRGMDPGIQIRIRIHTKMSWIRNTVYGKNFLFFFISDDLKRLVGVVQDGDPRPAISWYQRHCPPQISGKFSNLYNFLVFNNTIIKSVIYNDVLEIDSALQW